MKTKKAICLATAVVLTASMAAVFAGCGEKKVTITWYDNTEEIKTTKVKKGSTVEKWTPTKDGFIFVDWYEESSLSKTFDFDTKIEEDTDIFAKWRSSKVEEDNRIWYAIGSGAGTMKASNWKFATQAATDPDTEEVILDDDGYATYTVKPGFEDVVFTKGTKANDEAPNVYELTLTLYANDIFRFATNAYNDDWTGDVGKAEAGLGSLNGFAYKDDNEHGEVKDSAGTVVFTGAKEFVADPTSWNIKVAASGIYKFTLSTYPGFDSSNSMTWEKTGEAPVIEETHKMMFLGSHNGWNLEALDENGEAKNEEDLFVKQTDGTFKGYVTVEEDTQLKLYNIVSAAWYGENGDANFNITPGTWCFTYNPENDEIKYEKCEYYVVGTMRDGTENVNFENIKKDFAKMTTEDGETYTYELVVTDVSGVEGFTWLKEKNAVCAVKVAFGTSIGKVTDNGWYTPEGSADDGNYYFEAEGTYTVSINLTTQKVTITEKA